VPRIVRRPLPLLAVALAATLLAVPARARPDAPAPDRRAQLEAQAVALAAATGAVPVRDGQPLAGCPAGQLAVSWAPPVGDFELGAHIPPLGPAPGPASGRVNGVVVCRGHDFAYMGFEARWTATGWEVLEVPAPAGEEAAAEPQPRLLAQFAPGLPASGPGPVDPLAPYQPQTTCSPAAKPGVVGFRDLVLRSFPTQPSIAIGRDCSVGGRSEHKEGRAWDWGARSDRAAGLAAANRVTGWLLATDAGGRRYAMARRLGVMYIILNRRIWASYRAAAGWRPYTGANPHIDHVHISFSWAGARKQTSWWTGRAS
jgi:hypothetical protein